MQTQSVLTLNNINAYFIACLGKHRDISDQRNEIQIELQERIDMLSQSGNI